MSVFKKGTCTDCSIIVELPIFTKDLVSICNRNFHEQQAKFRPGGDCINQIFNFRQSFETHRIHHQSIIKVFYLKGVFDLVDRTALLSGLHRKYISQRDSLTYCEHYIHKLMVVMNYQAHSEQPAMFDILPLFLFNFAVNQVMGN